ncbi:MAG: HD domain-containing protein [Ginsengibacter sp.]
MKNFSTAEEFIFQMLKSKLPAKLTYHGFHHTLDVLDAALKIAKSETLDDEEIKLLRIAVLYHDAGFITIYKNHEEKGCEMAREYLPAYDFTDEEIDIVCNMIMATKIPQSPVTKLEKIICDADLDYLGREDFYDIGKKLFSELNELGMVKDEEEWDNIQKNFLGRHHYLTSFSRLNREPQKQEYLKEISQKYKVN